MFCAETIFPNCISVTAQPFQKSLHKKKRKWPGKDRSPNTVKGSPNAKDDVHKIESCILIYKG